MVPAAVSAVDEARERVAHLEVLMLEGDEALIASLRGEHDRARRELAQAEAEEHEREVREGVAAALAALQREPGSDWWMSHRRFMPAAVKSAILRKIGRRLFEKAFPLWWRGRAMSGENGGSPFTTQAAYERKLRETEDALANPLAAKGISATSGPAFALRRAKCARLRQSGEQ
jgi:hypothetical protein